MYTGNQALANLYLPSGFCPRDGEESPVVFSNPFFPVKLSREVLLLPFGLIQHPVILLIIRSILDDILPHVHLEGVSLFYYQIALTRWALIPLSFF